MWIQQLFLVITGLSAGILVAGGLFSFIVGLGVISDFADRTHTGEHVLLYEDCIMAGGMIGNLLWFYNSLFSIEIGKTAATFIGMNLGLFSGIFVGCWAMALAEMLEIFPIFVRRGNLSKMIPFIIVSIAIGKSVGTFVFLYNRW